jgi:hypothetical protein
VLSSKWRNPNKILNLWKPSRRSLVVVEGRVQGRLLYGGDASQSRGWKQVNTTWFLWLENTKWK